MHGERATKSGDLWMRKTMPTLQALPLPGWGDPFCPHQRHQGFATLPLGSCGRRSASTDQLCLEQRRPEANKHWVQFLNVTHLSVAGAELLHRAGGAVPTGGAEHPEGVCTPGFLLVLLSVLLTWRFPQALS